MNKIEKQFKKDFEQANKKDLSFDTNQLSENTRRKKHFIKPYKLALIISFSTIGCILIGFTAPIILSMIRVKENVKAYNRRYSMNEIRLMESNSFKKLNDINYPDFNKPVVSSISEIEFEAYSNFTSSIYESLTSTNDLENICYSNVGLYSLISNMAEISFTQELKDRFENLLGLSFDDRVSFYQKIMKANSFSSDNCTIQLKNAAFFSNKFDYNQNFVDSLSKVFCEAYQLDFQTSSDKIVEWANKAVNSDGFIDQKFLEMDDETVLYILSSLYFKNSWNKKYISSNNYKSEFFLSDGSSITTEYMRHSYMVDKYYDYGSYISFEDYYYDKNATITYIIPKDTSSNIHDLVKDTNIFENNEDNVVNPTKDYPHTIAIHLTCPKFKLKSDLNFKSTMVDLGFEDIFNRHIPSFNNAFDDEKISDYKVYLQTLKQRNEVEFNEDGTIVKNITLGGFGAANSAEPTEVDTLEVKLNQPFIYIIKDANGLPIFVGHIDNPIIEK